jgi:SagB-type dehydrogenase family enzyme
MANILLPKPEIPKSAGLYTALLNRESRRAFENRPLSPAELSALLWAAGGAKDSHAGARVPPSAGACYPLELYVSIRREGVSGIKEGVYLYKPAAGALSLAAEGDFSKKIAAACHGQNFVAKAQAVIALAAEFERSTYRYGERGARYVFMDAGHAGQNIYLAVEGIGLATCAVGAFDDGELAAAFHLPGNLKAVYIFPVGARRE